MAVLIGDVTPKDEFMHPVSSDPHFSENMLFTFFARDGSHGGLIRIGNRVNEGHAEVTFLLFLPDGRTLFQFRYIGQGMSAFESGDSAAFGLSEYMDLLVNGRRALTVG